MYSMPDLNRRLNTGRVMIKVRLVAIEEDKEIFSRAIGLNQGNTVMEVQEVLDWMTEELTDQLYMDNKLNG